METRMGKRVIFQNSGVYSQDLGGKQERMSILD